MFFRPLITNYQYPDARSRTQQQPTFFTYFERIQNATPLWDETVCVGALLTVGRRVAASLKPEQIGDLGKNSVIRPLEAGHWKQRVVDAGTPLVTIVVSQKHYGPRIDAVCEQEIIPERHRLRIVLAARFHRNGCARIFAIGAAAEPVSNRFLKHMPLGTNDEDMVTLAATSTLAHRTIGHAIGISTFWAD